jgi:hypothetical protein
LCFQMPFDPGPHTSKPIVPGRPVTLFQHGIGSGYLKLSVSWDLIINNGLVSLCAGPEVFQLIGIWSDMEKEKKERVEEQERKAKNRSPSPRES